ncbi:type VI secretion system accessory protein TagJ [Aquabacterium humicola]|uniref:type VI secretion system accessory protein TagJ n=1 Tax=Aquabacterium humicola TaxID=3237377 RepID=UPI002543D7A1|nr:type VI secretion system accessory protein TagJ [Rubrivivax pictus]
MTQTPQELLAAGDPKGALAALQSQVRGKAADAKLRIFLFQLLSVLGQWQRAMDQLHVCGELDAAALAMVNTYRPGLQCEAVREAVMSGKTLPHVFGPPTAWVALLAQALQADATGEHAQAAKLRESAFEQAEPTAGAMNGEAFDWIADADSRLGPVLEIVINGRYGWVPFAHLQKIVVEAPADLRDLVWTPAQITFANGGESVALIPTRYAGTATADADGALLMSRKTEWLELAEGQYRGLGQRVIATSSAELGLLEVRELTLQTSVPAEPEAPAAADDAAAGPSDGGG